MRLIIGLLCLAFVEFFNSIMQSIIDWYNRNSTSLWMNIISVVIITPAFLLGMDTIKQLPGIYYLLLFFWIFIYLIYAITMNEIKFHERTSRHNQRNNYYGSNNRNYDKPNNPWTNNNNTYYKSKPKPKGISKSAANKKKKNIREKLKENPELVKKYNL